MRDWLRKIVKRMLPWADCPSNAYLFEQRKRLNVIAEELSRKGGPLIYTRYNREQKCAEFYTQKGDIVARVVVHGEMGLPDEVFVACNLPIESEVLFSRFIPDLRIHFRALTFAHG